MRARWKAMMMALVLLVSMVSGTEDYCHWDDIPGEDGKEIDLGILQNSLRNAAEFWVGDAVAVDDRNSGALYFLHPCGHVGNDFCNPSDDVDMAACLFGDSGGSTGFHKVGHNVNPDWSKELINITFGHNQQVHWEDAYMLTFRPTSNGGSSITVRVAYVCDDTGSAPVVRTDLSNSTHTIVQWVSPHVCPREPDSYVTTILALLFFLCVIGAAACCILVCISVVILAFIVVVVVAIVAVVGYVKRDAIRARTAGSPGDGAVTNLGKEDWSEGMPRS